MLKIYFKVVLLFVMMFAVFGYFAPLMISYENTYVVSGGIGLIVLIIPICCVLCKDIYKSIERKVK